MLGRTFLVSMSDKRLGGIENSSLRYFSAMRALEVSTSRMVNPSFSRRVRRLLPAGSITRLQVPDIIAGRAALCHRILTAVACYDFRTRCDPGQSREALTS